MLVAVFVILFPVVSLDEGFDVPHTRATIVNSHQALVNSKQLQVGPENKCVFGSFLGAFRDCRSLNQDRVHIWSPGITVATVFRNVKNLDPVPDTTLTSAFLSRW